MKFLAMLTESRRGNSGRIMHWQMILACVTMLVLPGCGGSGSSLVKAKGKVLVDGTPASGAILLFHPESSSGNVANAIAELDLGTRNEANTLEKCANVGYGIAR